ncbi:MAG TPA: tetratricopeptide repeat protein [Planktothrix sp.]|jgi:tetratricopeptide (TPR) repeat protein
MKRAMIGFAVLAATLLVSAPPAPAASIFSLVNWLGGATGIPVPSPGGVQEPGAAAQTPRYKAMALAHQAYLDDQSGQHDLARQLLEQALQTDPSNELAWANLMVEYQLLGDLQQAVDLGNTYLNKFPHGSHRAKVEGLLSNARIELQREQKVAQALGPSTIEDYLPMTSEDGLLKHWPARSMPLKVFINDGTATKGYQPEMTNILIDSFKEWSFVSRNRLSFVPVSTAEQANIVCNWLEDAKKFPGGVIRYGECGLATPQYYQDGTICSAQIYLLTINKNKRGPLTLKSIHATSLHEIGHALGLIGHSDRPGDIMYFTGENEPTTEPHVSWRDVNTINKLYDIALSATPSAPPQQTIAADAFSNATTVPNSSPTLIGYSPSITPASFVTPQAVARQPQARMAMAATPLSLDTLSSGYMRGESYRCASQQFISNKEAIAYFEAAVARAPDSIPLLDDLGSAYNNRAAELAADGKISSSQSLLERALAIHKNSPDRDRMNATLTNYLMLLVKQGRLTDAQTVFKNYRQGAPLFAN